MGERNVATNMRENMERYRLVRALRLPWRVRHHLIRLALVSCRYRQPSRQLLIREEPGTHRLIAVGDIAPCGAPFRDWGPVRETLSQADVVIGNLESVLTDRQEAAVAAGTALRSKPQFASHLDRVFHGLTVANNHAMDYGPEALAESIDHLTSAGVQVCGAGRDLAEARRPALLTAGGVRIAVLGYCDRYGGTREDLERLSPAPLRPDWVRDDIRKVRPAADLIVVQLHWGYEFSLWPLASHRSLAHSFVDAGADLVLCHHAHVPLGWEARGRAVIAYGLGNFLFERSRYHQVSSPLTDRSVFLQAHFSRAGLHRVEAIPFRTGEDYRIHLLNGVESNQLMGVFGSVSRQLDRRSRLALIEHHCRIRDTLDFLRGFDTTPGSAARQFAASLDCPVWADTIGYLHGGSGSAIDAADLLEAIRESGGEARAAPREKVLDVTQRLASDTDLLPYQPGTTPWWVV
jgi:poly-gamma-glutamate synthesis protein (capsule biosynthesis protein)